MIGIVGVLDDLIECVCVYCIEWVWNEFVWWNCLVIVFYDLVNICYVMDMFNM